MTDTIIGIDFGTSFYRAAVRKDTAVELISNRSSEAGMGLILENVEQGIRPPIRFSSVKQKLGIEETMFVEDKEIRVIDLASNIFALLKDDARRYVNEEVFGAIVTVPPCFTERQREAIRKAAEKGGFGTVKLLDESTAAFLVPEVMKEEGNTILAYCLGGGVYTASVMRVVNGSPQPLWHEGDRRLGGNDFNVLMINYITKKFGLDTEAFWKWPPSIQEMRFLVEQAKVSLSKSSAIELNINNRELFPKDVKNSNLDELKFTLARSEFENIISEDIKNTIVLAKKAIQGAGCGVQEIDFVLLIGGSTRIPLIAKMLREEFKKEVIRTSDECIVRGAALYGAQMSWAAREDEGRENVKEKQPGQIERSETQESKSPREIRRRTWLEEFSHYLIESQLLWEKGNHDEGIEVFEALIQELPKFISNLYYSRGENLLNSNNIDQAFEKFEKGLVYDKDNIMIQKAYHSTCNKKAIALINGGNLIGARNTLKVGLKYNSACEGCRTLLGKVEEEIRRHGPRSGHLKFKGKKKRN